MNKSCHLYWQWGVIKIYGEPTSVKKLYYESGVYLFCWVQLLPKSCVDEEKIYKSKNRFFL